MRGCGNIISMTDLKDLWEGRLAPLVKERLEKGEQVITEGEKDKKDAEREPPADSNL